MKIFWSVLLISFFVFLNPAQSTAEPSKKLKVIATTSIIADWIHNVAGDLVELKTLVGPDGDAHTFEPTAQDSVLITKADVIFENGFGLEHWMNKLYAASDSKARRIVLSKSVVNNPLTSFEGGDGRHEDIDPHVWHNLRYAMGMVEVINRVLKSLDAGHAQTYENNTKLYLNQLQELDYWIMRNISSVPQAQRKLVTNHDSLGYFAERYQFELVGAAFDSVSTEAEDSSAKKMAELIFKIKKAGVDVVFTENINNSKLISALAKEAHIRLAPPLYSDALGVKGSPADTYLNMMQYNVKTIVSNLKKIEEKR